MAKITEKQAVELVGKFSRTANFPQNEAGVKDMARGLAEASKGDLEFARQIVDSLRRSAEFCPTDAQFFRAAEGLREGGIYKRLDERPSCPLHLCDGSGWLPCKDAAGNDASKRCDCKPAKQVAQAKPVDCKARSAGESDAQ